ncbi:MAG: hypothetical protein AAGC57_00795 [Pseudomonadota bacterium]
MRVKGVILVLALAGLAGCSLFEDDVPEPAPEIVAPPAPVAEAVQAVRRLELGTSRKGVVLAAFGTAPGLGYSKPRLVARRDGRPGSDGLLDYDFVIDPPPEGVVFPQGTAKAREVRADIEILIAEARIARGVRVHAVVGGVQMLF